MKSFHRDGTSHSRHATRALGALVAVWLLWPASLSAAEHPPAPTTGELRVVGPASIELPACPLAHTEVEADVAGFMSRVRVRQQFENPLSEKIEAVYVFPLPQDAAVDSMLMTVGDRRVVGEVKPRDEARLIYEAARAAGHVAGLLDQERPNIFTQSVANIEPGAQVTIEITYVETLRFDDGVFEFQFPMVVGPRYMPGLPTGKHGTGWAPDTTRVPDASCISPPVAPPATRAGHDIGLTVNIDAGSELFDLESTLHEVDVQTSGAGRAKVMLRNEAEIPNRDFVLHYRTATDEIGDAFLADGDERGTFFTLILEPPRRVPAGAAVPKEMIFVIDRSGSMEGFPIEKAKEAMRLAIEQMNPRDTFNLLSFAGGTGRCFDQAVPNTSANRAQALAYLADLRGSGGTEMMPAIHAALEGAADPERVRIVAFMTDGYIGNDFEIIDAVEKNAGTARVFAFGIGNSVNRFLLDGMAHAGRGEVEYVTLNGQAEEAIERFHERIHSPVLTDVAIDWGTLPVADVYPKRIPDLFSAKPITIHGRLTALAGGFITLHGRTAGGGFERHIRVDPSPPAAGHEVLASLWARAAIGDLMQRDLAALQRGDFPREIRDEITALGVEFHLVTQFTSFVAVEEVTVTVGGEPKTIAVPVEMPDGVSYEGVFGDAWVAGQVVQGGAHQYRAAGSFAAAAPAAKTLGLGMERLVLAEDRIRDERKKEEKDAAPQEKLAAPLRGLAEAVAKDGENGNLTVGKLRVRAHRVDVMIYLSDLSQSTRTALAQLGFVQSNESKIGRVLIGTVDVRELARLAMLVPVVRVAAVEA